MSATARVFYRRDWPPGSNERLLAERERQLHRTTLVMATALSHRNDPRPRTAAAPDPKLLGAEAAADSGPERLLRALLRIARTGEALPSRRELGRAIHYPEGHVKTLLGGMARRGALRFVAAEHSHGYAIRLLPDGPVLRTATGAEDLDP